MNLYTVPCSILRSTVPDSAVNAQLAPAKTTGYKLLKSLKCPTFNPKEETDTKKLSSVRHISIDNLIQKWYRCFAFDGYETTFRDTCLKINLGQKKPAVHVDSSCKFLIVNVNGSTILFCDL